MGDVIDIVLNYITKGDDKTKTALKDLATLTGTLGTAVAAAKAIYENTVAPTIEYASQIENLAAITQTGAEQTSKLIQVADDARVEYSTLQVGMKNLVKNGISPTITNLAALSDEYISIQDPVKRTQFAMELFGDKAGPQMAKLLAQGSAALLENAAAAEKVGLVMSEESLQAAKDYQASLDSLNDSIEGTKIKLGTAMIPALDDALKGTMAYVDGVILLRDAIVSKINPFDDAAVALEKQTRLEEEAALASEKARLEAEKAALLYQDAAEIIETQYNASYSALNTYVATYAENQIIARERTQELFDSINTNLDTTIAKWLEDLEWMQNGGLLLQQQFEAIKLAFVNNPTDPDIKRQMEDLYIKTQALKVALGEIDSTTAAKNIADNLGVSISDAYYLLDQLRDDIQAPLTLPVNVVYNDPGPTIPGGGSGSSGSGSGGTQPPQERAGGGVTYSGSPYIVGEEGWEPFFPKTDGRIISHDEAMQALSSTTVNNYYLSVNSTQSMGSITQDVGLMRARAGAF